MHGIKFLPTNQERRLIMRIRYFIKLITNLFAISCLAVGVFSGFVSTSPAFASASPPNATNPVQQPVPETSPLAPVISVAPTEIDSIQAARLVTESLTISNLGNEDLEWMLYDGNAVWSENFDSYATGSQMHGQGGWKGWFNNPGAGALTSDVQAHSVPNSVAVLGATDLVHEYSGYTAGTWIYTTWQFVPTDFSGQTFFIMLNNYNDGGVDLNWSVQVYFDAASNTVANYGITPGVLPLIKGSWVELRVVIDLDNDLQWFYYNNELLYTGTWTAEQGGGGIKNIGAVDLYAQDASVVYYDDISLVSETPPACGVWGDVPWLSTSPITGTTPISGTSPVDVLLNATGLDLGVYTAELCASSNDPVTPLLSIPVTMTVKAESDLSLVKMASSETVKVGEMITYTLVVSNAGPAAAEGVVLEDTLPDKVTFASASAGCNEAAGVVTCDVGALGVAEGATITITVNAATVGLATNTAEVSSLNFDPDESNNTATVDTTIRPEFLYLYLPFVQKP
jgi:uncharacterized repeat protein (TIGR01451 family)